MVRGRRDGGEGAPSSLDTPPRRSVGWSAPEPSTPRRARPARLEAACAPGYVVASPAPTHRADVTPPPSSDVPSPAPSLRARLTRGPVGWALGVGGCLLAAWLGQRSLSGIVADLDSFYHLAHAAEYRTGSVLDTSLPWASWSVIGDWGGDLWWGYHLLLVPFSLLGVTSGIAAAGFAGTAVLLVTFWAVLRSRGATALPWTLFVLLAVPNVLYRLLMTRPHVLSLAVVLGLAAALATRRWRWAATAAWALAWLHASLFWVAIAVAGSWAAARLLEPEGRKELLPDLGPAALAVGGGILAGLLLRPAPLATLRLVRVQLLDVLVAKEAELAQLGGDLAPLPLEAVLPVAWLFLLAWVPVVVGYGIARARRAEAWAALPPQRRVLGTLCALLGLAFLGLSLGVANRALTEGIVFSTAGVALLAPAALPRWVRRPAAWGVAAVTVAALPWMGGWHAANVRLNAVPDDRLREAAAWLAERSEPGELVFHAHWDSFGPLLAWNRVNHYLGGMDPVFLQAHDPAAWRPVAGLTGPGPLASDPSAVIRPFAPRWVLVEPRRDPALYEALRADPAWRAARHTRDAALFEPAGAGER